MIGQARGRCASSIRVSRSSEGSGACGGGGGRRHLTLLELATRTGFPDDLLYHMVIKLCEDEEGAVVTGGARGESSSLGAAP